MSDAPSTKLSCPRCYQPVQGTEHFCPCCGAGIAAIPCPCTQGLRPDGKWGSATPLHVEQREDKNKWVQTRLFCPVCQRSTRFFPRSYFAVDAWNHWVMGRGNGKSMLEEDEPVPATL